MNSLLGPGMLEPLTSGRDNIGGRDPGSRGLLARIRASLRSPLLVGEQGARTRYLRVQWWVAFWRIIILIQIPEVAIVRPQRFGSLETPFLLLGLALAYAILYYLLATRSRLGRMRRLHVADLIVCAALMLLAHNDKLIFIFCFYSYSSLLARPTVLLREMIADTVALSLAYMLAYALIGTGPLTVLSNVYLLGSFVLYYFWGLGFAGFSAVLDRASSLELDARLAEQRQSYRRRLHDDLGNTLCGLHFKIQSLRHGSAGDLRQSLAFLARGYERANSVLRHLLSGLDEEMAGGLTGALTALAAEVRQTGGHELRFSLPKTTPQLSPEVEREVIGIIREAVMNAVKHSGAAAIAVTIRMKRAKMVIVIADHGRGFDQAKLEARQVSGSKGIRGMRERAALLKGQLRIDSDRTGTRVTLKVAGGRGTKMLNRILDYDPENSLSGIYPFLVRLRTFMFVWTLAELFLQPAGRHLSIALIVVVSALTLDSLAWIVLRSPLFRLLSWQPWLLVLENLGFIAVLHVCLHAGIPFFFTLYLGVSVIMNGMFLDALSNLAMTMVLNAGIIAMFASAPAAFVDLPPAGRYEPPLQHTTIFSILAVSAGLAGEFVKSLEVLQLKAVSLALSRQRDQLSRETHRQLHSLVNGLSREIASLTGSRPQLLSGSQLKGIETRSTDLKTRLRTILRSLDEPAPMTTPDPGAT